MIHDENVKNIVLEMDGYSYSTVNGNGIRTALLKSRKPYLHVVMKGIYSKKKWWQVFGDEARKVAKKLHLPGPNLADVGPILTPDLVSVKSLERYEYSPAFQDILDEILRYLVNNGYAIRHTQRQDFYKLTCSGQELARYYKKREKTTILKPF